MSKQIRNILSRQNVMDLLHDNDDT